MTRIPLVVGNWKMELSHKASTELGQSLKKQLHSLAGVDVVVCPSYPSLSALAEIFGTNGPVSVGAQNVHWEEKGAVTGAVSVTQLTPFASWCIVGHSEQRSLTGITDDLVQQQAKLLLKHGLTPIICLGDNADEHAGGQTDERITTQITGLLQALTRVELVKTVIAYEPIWAISSMSGGVAADPDEAAGTMLLIRKLIAGHHGQEAAERVRIIYGGSVSPQTVGPFAAEPGIDGVLVGSASTHPMHFLEIINNFKRL